MPTIGELEQRLTTDLAAQCQGVAEDPIHYTQIGADEAMKLKLEWVKLAGAFHTSAKEQSASEAQMKLLHHRMAEFLAGIL